MRFLFGLAIVVIAAAGAASLAGSGDPSPEPGPPAVAEEQIGPWIEEAEPELRGKLAQAERAAAEGRWGDAALTWQQILDTAPPRLVNVRPDTPNTFCDVREAIRIRLSTLPPDGLAAYRRASDPAAEGLFRRAIREREDAALADVWRRFALTSFGPRALLVLADRALRRGEIETALARLETLVYYGGEVDRPGVLLRRAWCRARRGEAFELAACKREAEASGNAEVVLGGRRVSLPDAVNAIARHDPDAPTPAGWPLPGGAPDRNRRAADLPGRLRLVGHMLVPERVRRPDGPAGPVRTDRTAVVLGDVVYVKDPARLLRLRLVPDGIRPLAPVRQLDYFLPRDEEPVGYEEARTHPAVGIGSMLVMAHETPLGDSVASMLVGLGLGADRDPIQIWVRGGGRHDSSSLAGEPGDARNPFEEDFYADVSFAGSPAVWGGRLYVSGAVFDRKIGVHLFCLEPTAEARGRTVFRRLVGYGTALGGLTAADETREYPGSPAIKDGVVYVSTNLGAVAALDALTGDVLWLHRYPRAVSRRVQGSGLGARPTWRTDFPIVAEGAVFFTPSDCDRLLVYAPRIDRRTGLVLRSARVRRTFPGAEIRYEDLVGIADGVLFLTGRASPADEGVPVEARKAWPTGPGDQREDLWVGDPPENRVTGRGFLTETSLVVPTRKGIYAFPLRGDGRYEVIALDEDLPALTLPSDRPPRVFGNLTPAGDRVISVTPDGVFVFGPGADGTTSPSGRRR